MSLSALERRFWRSVGLTTPPPGINGLCWIWTGARNASGSPRWWREGRAECVHVWAWEARNGPKPPGRQLTPRCGRSGCVRPDHRQLRPRGQHRTPKEQQQ